MDSLKELYQEIILEHNKHPRNAHKMECPTCSAEGVNPLCGDEVIVFVKLDGDTITDVSFLGQGCAISQASASLMTLAIKGKTIEEAQKQTSIVFELLTNDILSPSELDKLGDLVALSGVRQFPARIKCATLAWHSLESALRKVLV
ncbi:MAG: SUF system NifU family Fe-S cluster assembly protein [Verrucomicrobia bacterium GWC2_42_7]|nr:MAG: SUF system NifU family Fe-S cluster assembly protein [Verrucomicrobia bacterium GWC2_42_7]